VAFLFEHLRQHVGQFFGTGAEEFRCGLGDFVVAVGALRVLAVRGGTAVPAMRMEAVSAANRKTLTFMIRSRDERSPMVRQSSTAT